MSKRRVKFTHRKQRAILTDMLPFEVPPTFSNRGYYAFLREHQIKIHGEYLCWKKSKLDIKGTMKLLFGISESKIKEESLTRQGVRITRYCVPIRHCQMNTIPFNFRVAHKTHIHDGRTLSVVHPRNQLKVDNFYAQHSASIIYYTSLSAFSIRRPISIARHTFFDDNLHQETLEKKPSGVEEKDREYEQIGSYFVYRKYSNIYRFFESYKYHRCEKKYNEMVQIDINKCFDSIYTHSLSWAVIGKDETKYCLKKIKGTFADKFDRIMQQLNHGETNGIVIGSEFSRIFAEIILQSVDVELERALFKRAKLKHKTDYEIFRYVDDFFVFFNKPDTKQKVIEELQEILKDKKLAINDAKMKSYSKPIITEITIAKERISELMNSQIKPEVTNPEVNETDIERSSKCNTDLTPLNIFYRAISEFTFVKERISALVSSQIKSEKLFKCKIDSNRLIIRYKAIIKETGVEYSDILNYTLAIIEKKIDKIHETYLEARSSNNNVENDRCMVESVKSLLEFAFFIYSASPKVNHTIRMCRTVTSSVDFLNKYKFLPELKHLLFKFVHDNASDMLKKNSMSAHREIESLYLLIMLSQIGKEYWLPEQVIAKHFLITYDEKKRRYSRKEFLNHFSITVLLSYMRNKTRYDELRKFIEKHIIDKLNQTEMYGDNHTESLMLFLDIITCPYVSLQTRNKAGKIFGLKPRAVKNIENANDYWFTAWDNKFNLKKELDAKRSREVY